MATGRSYGRCPGFGGYLWDEEGCETRGDWSGGRQYGDGNLPGSSLQGCLSRGSLVVARKPAGAGGSCREVHPAHFRRKHATPPLVFGAGDRHRARLFADYRHTVDRGCVEAAVWVPERAGLIWNGTVTAAEATAAGARTETATMDTQADSRRTRFVTVPPVIEDGVVPMLYPERNYRKGIQFSSRRRFVNR